MPAGGPASGCPGASDSATAAARSEWGHAGLARRERSSAQLPGNRRSESGCWVRGRLRGLRGAKGKVTRRERFLAEMDDVIPWIRVMAVIEPHYTEARAGRQPLGLKKVLRIYFLQQWFDLSDPQAEDAT